MIDTLITNGDSWTFGSEIAGADNVNEYDSEYRKSRIWPAYLGDALNIRTVVNIAVPARSNDSILESTISWLLENYINPCRDTSRLLVVLNP